MNSRSEATDKSGNRVLMQQLFRCQLLGLYKLVHHFGGSSLAQGLDERVAESARVYQWLVDVRQGRLRPLRADLDWFVYRSVMETAMEHTVSVAGRQLVKRRIQSVTRALEQRSGQSYFEVAYRLGLHRPGLNQAA